MLPKVTHALLDSARSNVRELGYATMQATSMLLSLGNMKPFLHVIAILWPDKAA